MNIQKTLLTLNLILRSPKLKDLAALKNFEDRNKNHLAKWESTADFSSPEACENRLRLWEKECREGNSIRFFIFKKDHPHLIIGMCNFTQIFRGPFQACYLGYKIDHLYEGKGWMSEALQSSIHYVFEEVGLHRVMANYIPSNNKSAKLLRRLGFEMEGYAKNYLLINGQWEDHVLTALSYEKWKMIQERNSTLTLSIEKELQDYLYQHIPISQAIGIKVELASLNEVILTAPFSNNINHKKTIFGGSLHAVATLACWSLVHLNLKNQLHLPIQIVITKSEINYYAPIANDFKVNCIRPDNEIWNRFMKILHSRGKGRIHLLAHIYHEGQLCVEYEASFAAIISR